MDDKNFVFITGTTCVGKSTLLHTIQNSNPLEIAIIPQTTTRAQRSDDVISDFRYVSEIRSEDMYLCDTDRHYGIAYDDINAFKKSDKKLGVAVISCDEILQLKAQNKAEQYQTILMTFTNSPQQEIETLDLVLSAHYDEPAKTSRLDYFTRLIQKRLLNSDFIKTNINFHFVRDLNSEENFKVLSKMTGISDTTLKYHMKQILQKAQVKRHSLSIHDLHVLNNTR